MPIDNPTITQLRSSRAPDEAQFPAWLPASLAVLLFFSGFSALVYQILWLRLLSLVFGVTVHAASAVLASFMAGLALGSFAAGRLADRVVNPLRWFAAAEAGVALSALATPQVFSALERAYRDLYPALANSPGLITAARFLCSFCGAHRADDAHGRDAPARRAVVAHAIRTAGRARQPPLRQQYQRSHCGDAARWVLHDRRSRHLGDVSTRRVGEPARSLFAAAISIVPGRAFPSAHGRPSSINANVAPDSAASSTVSERVRTLVLETFLTGIAAGSAVMTPLMRRHRDWPKVLAIVQLITAVAILLSLRLLAETYQAGRTIGTAQASAVAIFPATLLMGIAFPIGVRLYAGADAEASGHTAERIGVLYSVNVCGAILGAIGAAFLLLPALGSRLSLIVVAFMYVVAGLLLLAGLPRPRLRQTVGIAVTGVAAFAGAAMDLPDPFDAVQARRYRGERLFWREEGVQTTVSVHVRPLGGRVLYLDGLHQANTSAEMTRVHAEIGHLPMLLYPDPKNALVVGLGGGVTAGAVSTHAGVMVDVVELSEAVVRGSDWFRNYDVLRRPNVHLRIDDGRNYLMLTKKKYDVVTADLIQPIHAGAGNLYSVEYFRLARAALKNDGVMLQWIGHRPETQYKLIMRTFLTVFPHTTLWMDGSLMVGAKRPLRINRADFERKLQDPVTRVALQSVGLESFDALLGRYTAGPEELRRLVESGPILSDDRPMIEYHRSLRDDNIEINLSRVRGDVWRHVVR